MEAMCGGGGGNQANVSVTRNWRPPWVIVFSSCTLYTGRFKRSRFISGQTDSPTDFFSEPMSGLRDLTNIKGAVSM